MRGMGENQDRSSVAGSEAPDKSAPSSRRLVERLSEVMLQERRRGIPPRVWLQLWSRWKGVRCPAITLLVSASQSAVSFEISTKRENPCPDRLLVDPGLCLTAWDARLSRGQLTSSSASVVMWK